MLRRAPPIQFRYSQFIPSQIIRRGSLWDSNICFCPFGILYIDKKLQCGLNMCLHLRHYNLPKDADLFQSFSVTSTSKTWHQVILQPACSHPSPTAYLRLNGKERKNLSRSVHLTFNDPGSAAYKVGSAGLHKQTMTERRCTATGTNCCQNFFQLPPLQAQRDTSASITSSSGWRITLLPAHSASLRQQIAVY